MLATASEDEFVDDDWELEEEEFETVFDKAPELREETVFSRDNNAKRSSINLRAVERPAVLSEVLVAEEDPAKEVVEACEDELDEVTDASNSFSCLTSNLRPLTSPLDDSDPDLYAFKSLSNEFRMEETESISCLPLALSKFRL
jgi:hypothetical protein